MSYAVALWSNVIEQENRLLGLDVMNSDTPRKMFSAITFFRFRVSNES